MKYKKFKIFPKNVLNLVDNCINRAYNIYESAKNARRESKMEEQRKAAEYEEDLKISNYVFNRCFKKYHYLKDDLIQESLIALWKARKNFNEIKSSYITYSVEVAKNAMRMLLRKEYKHLDNKNLDDLKIDIEDEKIDIEKSIYYREVVQKTLDNLKSGKEILTRIIDLLELGFNQFEIGDLFNLSKKSINKKLKKFKQVFNELND